MTYAGRRWRNAATLLAVTVLLGASTGCYTRLTTPKEAIFYTNPDGSLREVDGKTVAKMIRAPEYNAYLRSKHADGQPPFLLPTGAVVDVKIYGHGIQESLTIRPDGVVDLPLIGEVTAAGRTVANLKDEIATKYAKYYVDQPQVIINTDATENDSTINAGHVSVIQPTGSQGVFDLTGDEYLSQCLASTGALHEKAEWNEIAVIRRGLKETNERFIIVVDFERLLRYGDLDEDLRLRSGDIVFIPHEKNTLLEEIVASFKVLGGFLGDVQSVHDYVERIEGY